MSHPFQPPSLAQLAALLPAYEMQGFIAQGGMGAVYKARQIALDREVAIKVLPPELGADPQFRESFQREARAMARLNHPNLISVYDCGEVHGMLYIVMEFVAGESLYHAAFGKRLDPKEAVRLVLAIARGLAHAHEAGIVHRDIKPANILLTPKAEPKIGDFGLAHPEDAQDPGLAMGTMGYTAPEVTMYPQASSDPRADIYPLGVILYELLTGSRQSVGAAPPSTVVGTDAALDAIWQRATASHPQMRYLTAQAMADALEQWLRQPAAGRAAAPGPKPGTGPMARPQPRQPQVIVARSSSGGGLGTTLVIVALLVVAYFVWKNRMTPRVITIHEKQTSEETDDAAPTSSGAARPRPPQPPPLKTGTNGSGKIETPFGSRPALPGETALPKSGDSAPDKPRRTVDTVFGSRELKDGETLPGEPAGNHAAAPVVGTWQFKTVPNRKVIIAANGTFTLEDGRGGTWAVTGKGVYRLTWEGHWMELRQEGDEFTAKTENFSTYRLVRE